MGDKLMHENYAARTYVPKEIDSNPRKPYTYRTKVLLAALLVLLLGSILTGFLIHYANNNIPDLIDPRPPSESILHVFKRAAACTDAPPCSQVGKDTLAQNGSAVDAAIASMLCNGLLNQQSTGLGGGFFMTVYIREEGRAYTVEAREEAPAAATTHMFAEGSDQSVNSARSVAVPGQLRGLWTAYQRWGKLPWASLVAPAIKICREGFPLSGSHHESVLERAQEIKNDPHLRKMYVDAAGKFYEPGSIVRPSPVLCETIEIIAKNGGDELHNGSLSVQFAEDLRRAGSIVTLEDLQNYRPKITEALAVPFGDGDTLYTAPPPAGGLVLVSILNILAGYKFNASSIASMDDKILTHHRIVEAFKHSYALRSKIGDPDFLNLTDIISNVTSPEYGEAIRLKIDDNKTSSDAGYYGADEYAKPDSGTAHISILAANGDAVTATSSIDIYFGAGFTSSTTGIVLNNVMDDFSSPGIINYYDVKPARANFIAPGKRPQSSMAPTILVNTNKDVKLVIGSSGGTRITTSVALVIIRKLWFGQSIKEAIDEPRVHHQLFPMEVRYEYGMQDALVKGLRAKGHEMARWYHTTRSSVNCSIYKNSTAIYANADFRKGGDVCGIDWPY